MGKRMSDIEMELAKEYPSFYSFDPQRQQNMVDAACIRYLLQECNELRGIIERAGLSSLSVSDAKDSIPASLKEQAE